MLIPILMSPADLAYPITTGIVSDSFTSDTIVQATATDGVNLITSVEASGIIRVHSGFSDTVTQTFDLGGSVSGLTVVGGGLVAADGLSDTITFYDGISSTVLSSFSYNGGRGLASASGNLIACNSSTTVTIFNGSSSTVLDTIEVAGPPNSVAYDGVRLHAGVGSNVVIFDGLTSAILDTVTLSSAAVGMCFLGGDLVATTSNAVRSTFQRYEAG